MLIATLLITGFATFADDLVPTYDSIGIWGAVILRTIRFIQGIEVGGELGGSVLLSMEWARTNNNRGFIASCPQLGVSAGLLLAYSAVLIFSWLSGDQFLVWGWRIPFLLSIIMAGVGLYIRLAILDAHFSSIGGGKADRASAGSGSDPAPGQGDHPVCSCETAETARPIFI